jgi:uncharacterized membrane protein YbhN (UPF0104 family)
MLNILPFRTGEFSYLKLLKKFFKIPYSNSISKLALIRFFDFLVLAMLFLLSFLFFGNIILENFVFYLILFFSVGCVLAFLILIKYVHVLQRFNIKFLNYIIDGMSKIKKIGYKQAAYIFCLSFLYWISRFLFGYFVLLWLGVDFNIWFVIFVTAALMLTALIPIQIFLNLGIFEFGWAYFISSIGLDYNLYIQQILLLHLVPVIPVFVLGLLSYFFTVNSKSISS